MDNYVGNVKVAEIDELTLSRLYPRLYKCAILNQMLVLPLTEWAINSLAFANNEMLPKQSSGPR